MLPLIPPNEMGNTAALGAAMNKMYVDLLSALNRQTLETNSKFEAISNDIASIRDTNCQMSVKLSETVEQINHLKSTKVDISDMQRVSTETKSFKEEMIKRVSEQDNRIAMFEKRMQGISNAIEGNRCSIALVKEEIHRSNEAYGLENERLKNTQNYQAERINTLEIKSSRLHLNIEGVPEEMGTDPALQIITKFNEETDAGLSKDDFKAAWRIGTYINEDISETIAGDGSEAVAEGEHTNENDDGKDKPIKRKKPRSVSVILASESARDKIMSCRSKLQKYDDGSYLWINEIQPEAYRRRKSMLRDLIKLAKRRGFKDAKIENGGIRTRGVLYTPDKFDDLPEAIQPKQVRTRKTKNKGIAFCSEWSCLSNMAPAQFYFRGKQYSSSEQCFQAEKASFHGKTSLVRRIEVTEDPYRCKKIGEECEVSPEWAGARETVMSSIVYQKFSQNAKMKAELLSTGKASLYEAVSGKSDWSTHTPIYAKATYEETSTGPNLFGKVLEQVRESLGGADASQQTG